MTFSVVCCVNIQMMLTVCLEIEAFQKFINILFRQLMFQQHVVSVEWIHNVTPTSYLTSAREYSAPANYLKQVVQALLLAHIFGWTSLFPLNSSSFQIAMKMQKHKNVDIFRHAIKLHRCNSSEDNLIFFAGEKKLKAVHWKIVFIMLTCASKKLVHETQISTQRGIFCNIRFIISRSLSSVKCLCWTYTYDPITGFWVLTWNEILSVNN